MLKAALLLRSVRFRPGSAGSGPAAARHSPTLSRTHIAFAYAGDLWTVPRAGGEAVRLTAGVGIETGPRFSPDGTTLAFTGEYDGNLDVYIVPATGGVPQAPDLPPGRGLRRSGGRRTASASSSRPRASARTGDSAGCSRWPRTAVFPDALPLPMGSEGAYVARRRAASPTCRSRARSTSGSVTAAARRRRSGSPASPTRASSACRAPTRTTSTRCGRRRPRPRVLPLGPRRPHHALRLRHAPRSRWRGSSRTTASTSSRPRPAPTGSCTSSSAASTCST